MDNQEIAIAHIQERIFTIRGLQVMFDSDLAEIYGVETRVFNQAVKRNIDRFPERFRFKLTDAEYEDLRSQIVTSSDADSNLKSQIATPGKHGGRRYLPYVFTEQGVSMLSAVLRSETAIQVSIRIMDAFVQIRKFILGNAGLFQRLGHMERRHYQFIIETDRKFETVFKALEASNLPPKQGIFFNGQMYDAYTFVADLVRKAQKSIILIDNYVDDSVLTLLCKRTKNVTATIFTKTISKQLKLDLKKHNSQYPEIELFEFKEAHDRFLMLDGKELYHFGASLKDLGKKWFAFSRMDFLITDVLDKLKEGGRDE